MKTGREEFPGPGPTHDRSELAADLRELVRSIEEVHPEPFRGYDGRVELHARVEELVQSLPEEATTESFYRIAAPVVSGLDDVHSLLHPPDGGPGAGGTDRRMPLSFRVVGEELYVESVATESLADLVGGRLLAVEGVPVPDLVDRSRRFRAAENRYGAFDLAAGMIERHQPLARLLDRDEPPATPTVSVEVSGERRTLSVDPVTGDPDPAAELERTFDHPAGSGPRYRLYDGGRVAAFVPGNLSDYRESVEAKRAASADVAAEHARAAYERHVGGDPPDELDRVVAALPSMTATLEAMGEAMADADTETLVVDLRDNPGGDSQFVFHLAYLLDGWEGVARAAEGIRVVRRRTEPYRRRYGSSGDTGATEPMDYDFSGYFEGSSPDGTGPPPMVRQLLARSETATGFLERVDEGGAYRPDRLVVAVSAGTMSSAFAGAAQLTRLGAGVVGVPSGQAPVSFGEHVELELPNTGLDVRLSGSMYHWVEDPDGDVLEPDRELTPSRFEASGPAADAGLRLAFEYAGHGDVTEDGADP